MLSNKANSGHPGRHGAGSSRVCALASSSEDAPPTMRGGPNGIASSCAVMRRAPLQLLHLSGYDLPIEEIRNFSRGDRKSRVPRGATPFGVETTNRASRAGIARRGNGHAEVCWARSTTATDDRRSPNLGVRERRRPDGGGGRSCIAGGSPSLAKLTVIYDDNSIRSTGAGLAFSEDVGCASRVRLERDPR